MRPSVMNSRSLMSAVMRREPTPRIPSMPQITHDLPVRIYAAESGADWMEGMRRCAEDPSLIYDLVIRIVREVGCDGLRLFLKPVPARVVRDGEVLVVLDPESGARIGRLDAYGGGGFVADKPRATIDTLDEAKARLSELVADVSDEKLDLLRAARARVPDLFVATSPGGMTMNIYTELRGREQAMRDFFDRPDFVSAVMMRQAEAAIKIGARLLGTGVDAFYIGDPAASASLISPVHFERFCLPAYQAFCHEFRDRVLIYIHVCGNSSPILEMLADSGAHCVEPLDPLGGVSVADAKRRIGSRVALMGGVNTLTLAAGSADEVRQEAIRKCVEGGPNGYILAAGDMVPPETTLENLHALVDVASHSAWREV